MHWSELDSITNKLIRHTRALETAFKQWSLGQAVGDDVSHAFVQLGNEFMAAQDRLSQSGVDVSDLINVPQELRVILESALAMKASPQVVDTYDPQIRHVMTRLFHQLKAKQLQLQAAHHNDPALNFRAAPSPVAPQSPQPRPAPSPAAPTPAAQPAAKLVHHDVRQAPPRAVQRAASDRGVTQATGPQMSHPRRHLSDKLVKTQAPAPPGPPAVGPPTATTTFVPPRIAAADALPRIDRPLPSDPPQARSGPSHTPLLSSSDLAQDGDRSPEENALLQLHRTGALERQASKRYSTRQISKMVNGSPAEKSSLPTAGVHRTFAKPEFSESSVVKEGAVPEMPQQSHRRRLSSVPRRAVPGSPMSPQRVPVGSQPLASPGSLGPRPSPGPQPPSSSPMSGSTATPQPRSEGSTETSTSAAPPASPSTHAATQPPASTESSAPSSVNTDDVESDITVFLRLGSSVRKGRVSRPASIAALRLQFVEVCAYSPSAAETFPEILVQDPTTAINYEVTEATIGDVVDGSLVTLNVKSEEEQTTKSELKEIKQSLKELATQIGTIARDPLGSRDSIPGSRGLGSGGGPRGSIKPQSPSVNFAGTKFTSPVLTGDGKFILEKPQDQQPPAPGPLAAADTKEALLREIEQIRTTSNRTVAQLRSEITHLRSEVKKLASAPVNVVADRSAMAKIRERMDSESSDLLAQLEDISDIIDRQRLDVLSGGYRYSQHELEQVRKMLNNFSKEFMSSEHFLKSEQPVWKRVWQTELTEVIESQDWVRNLAALYKDIRKDMEDSLQTFALVCEANQTPKDSSARQVLPVISPIEPGKEQQVADAVFHEIQALNLNSEQRTVAVQRAERHHKAKQALRTEEFEAELNTFVSDSKLKSNGGFEEIEKRIQEREQRARKLGEESEIEGRRQAELLRKERKAKREARVNPAPKSEAATEDVTQSDAPKSE